jgi:hypothetical protein
MLVRAWHSWKCTRLRGEEGVKDILQEVEKEKRS